MTPTTLNASCGWFMMGHYWWGGNLSYPETASGVLCWLAGLYKHIYRGCNDAAHCLPYTLASWDCQERTEALHQEEKLGSVWSGHKKASRPRRRSRSSSRHHSRTLALRDWSGHSCCSPPNMPPRCHCGEPLFRVQTPCPSSPWQSTFQPMPSLATSAGKWPGPPWMMMPGRMTSKPHTCWYTV